MLQNMNFAAAPVFAWMGAFAEAIGGLLYRLIPN
jgi:hypothetical protein